MNPRKHLSWWAAAVMTALLFCFVLFFTDMRYCLNDDAILGRSMAGCVGGVPETFNPYTHVFFTWIVHLLTLLNPLVMWYSVLQLALLLLGCFVLAQGVVRAALSFRLPPWAGCLLGAAYLGAFALAFASGVTYTQTVAIVGAASVWQLLAADFHASARLVRKRLLGSAGTLLCGYLLRPMAALPSVCLWGAALVCKLLLLREDGRLPNLRPILQACGLALLVFLAAGAIGATGARLLGEEDYLAWQEARTEAMDYGGFARATDEALEKAGWTENDYRMASDYWFFMDANMSSEKLSAVSGAQEDTRGLARRLQDAVTLLVKALKRYDNVLLFSLLCAGFCLLAFLRALCVKRRRLWALLSPVLCGASAAALLLLLALQGRLPMRAAASVLLPACSLAAWLALRALRAPREPSARGLWGRLPVQALAIGCAAGLLWGSYTAAAGVYVPPSARADPSESVYAKLDRYAAAHPDLLLIGDNALDIDRRLFPSWGEGKPDNLLFIWGSWNNHSAGYRALLARFGYRHDAFLVTNFLDDSVRLVTSLEAPPEAFMDYLRQRAGGEVSATVCETGNGFTVFRLSLVQPVFPAISPGGNPAASAPEARASARLAAARFFPARACSAARPAQALIQQRRERYTV